MCGPRQHLSTAHVPVSRSGVPVRWNPYPAVFSLMRRNNFKTYKKIPMEKQFPLILEVVQPSMNKTNLNLEFYASIRNRFVKKSTHGGKCIILFMDRGELSYLSHVWKMENQFTCKNINGSGSSFRINQTSTSCPKCLFLFCV